MRTTVLSFLACSLVLFTASCGRSEPEPAEPSTGSFLMFDATDSTHTVQCGCITPEVGMCGNYIEVMGKMVPLEGDLGLGVMEWCGQDPQKAVVSGSLVDGAFVATKYELVE